MVNRGHDGMQRRHPCGRTRTLARRTAAAPVDDVAEVGTWLDDDFYGDFIGFNQAKWWSNGDLSNKDGDLMGFNQ